MNSTFVPNGYCTFEKMLEAVYWHLFPSFHNDTDLIVAIVASYREDIARLTGGYQQAVDNRKFKQCLLESALQHGRLDARDYVINPQSEFVRGRQVILLGQHRVEQVEQKVRQSLFVGEFEAFTLTVEHGVAPIPNRNVWGGDETWKTLSAEGQVLFLERDLKELFPVFVTAVSPDELPTKEKQAEEATSEKGKPGRPVVKPRIIEIVLEIFPDGFQGLSHKAVRAHIKETKDEEFKDSSWYEAIAELRNTHPNWGR